MPSTKPSKHNSAPRRIGRQIAAAVAASVVLAAGTVSCTRTNLAPVAAGAAEAADEAPQPVVKLSAGKLESARLHVAACEFQELTERRTMPGKISYNEAKHLELKTPVAGIVKKVIAAHRQQVRQGDSLAVLTSREIGLARDEVARCNADLEIARKQSEWATQIDSNLSELLAALAERPDPAVVAKAFADKVLGEYRDTVLAAYSKLVLAEAVMAQIGSLEGNSAISGRTLQERRSNREVAAAAFETACEQSKFAAAQARDKGRAALQQAERVLAVSCQQLESLGGSCSESGEVAKEALSELVVRAPFEGVVQDRLIVDAAQVSVGQPLFVLADTRTLWVLAEVHERDWIALKTAAQHELMVRAPGLPEGEAVASVKFTEGSIAPESRTVTLVGELDNRLDQFRPGMFVWVSAAVAPPRKALAVPAGAIMRHEQAIFVFVAEAADTFRRVDVTLGLETPEWVEITSGLTEGRQVVDQGAFFLKSELLLEREAE
jgi:cobalt-zinc-cadmium efflux system membrane fusion protein